MKLLAIVGTNAPQSYNRRLLQYMKAHFNSSASIELVEIANIPLFSEAKAETLPTEISTLCEKVSHADGVIFGVPEYDHSIPAALKSVLEWLSFTVHPLQHKPVMIVGTSLGTQGTSYAQTELRRVLNAPGVDAIVLPGNEFLLSYAGTDFDEEGQLKDERTIKFLESCFGNFLDMIQLLNGTHKAQVKWDGVYDVVVLGFGGAGATAARFAADGGAKVLVVEAAPFGHEGGNTRYSAQHVVYGTDYAKLKQYYQRLNYPLQNETKAMTTYLKAMLRMPTFFERYLGVQPVSWLHDITDSDPVMNKKTVAEYPEYEGSETIDFALVHHRDRDASLWKNLRQQVLDRADKINIWLDSRAIRLISDEQTKTIIGVAVERHGQTYKIAAKKGVVLATGGFENNQQMIQDYLHCDQLTPLGTLYNRGDGIKMAQSVGAGMWHMANFESHGVMAGLTFAENPGERGRQLSGWKLLDHGSIFVIADDGTRYFPENASHRHGHINIHGTWKIPMHNVHPYLIFDETQYQQFKQQAEREGKLPYPSFLEKLIRAKTLPDLAQKLSVPTNNLTATVKDFNHFVQIGRDFATGRAVTTMRAFDGGPFYAIAMAQDILNTQGGPVRNDKAQVLDVKGNPIKHLYSAGELGGITVNLYQGGGNLAECLIFGKIAGEQAAMQDTDESKLRVSDTVINDIQSNESLANIELGADQYLGTSNDGIGGGLAVRVTYNHHKIQNVEVVQQHESENVGDVAVKELPLRIVAANSVDVDAISGASASSRAIKEATKDALNKIKSR